ncbi:histidinol-phosphate transaminase [soil metagenome]
MSVRPNPPFAEISPVAHGAFDHGELTELGLSPEDVIDFSSSINPYGPAAVVKQAAREAEIERYPDKECRELRNALAEHLDVEDSCLAVGNGSAELIDHLARIYLSSSDTTLIVGPTFGEYERASRLCRTRVLYWNRAVLDNEVKLDLENLLQIVEHERPRVVWLCNPNNPTGDYLRRSSVECLLEATAAAESILVIDEAYLDLMLEGEPDDLADLIFDGDLVLLRSMTKSHALAGLRLGYVLAAPPIVRALAVARPPWNVGAPAQAAGVAALSAPAMEHLEISRQGMSHTAAYLRQQFADLGYEVLPGSTNFLLVKAGDAARLRQKLLRRGLQVRDCASFGLSEYIRVAVRRPEECRRLVSELRRLDFGTASREGEYRSPVTPT